jgi:hypothetical protein
MPIWERLVGEVSLVAACLAGDHNAREQLAEEYDGVLRHSIQRRVRSCPDHYYVADDLTNNLWQRLAAENYEPLRSFDPAQGTLAGFLQVLGQRAVSSYFRRRRRRRKGGKEEVCLAHPEQAIRSDLELALGLQRAEFLATLTSQERRFLDEYVLRPASERPTGRYCPSQICKLRQRLLQKMQLFLRAAEAN